MGKIADSAAVESVGVLVTDQESNARVASVSALGSIGDKRAITFLASALAYPEAYVRRAASNSLRKIDPERSQSAEAQAILQELGTEISDEGETISFVQGALGMASGPSDAFSLQMREATPEAEPDPGEDPTIKPLIAELRSADPTLRFRAARDLAKTGNPGACRALELAFEDAVPPVRRGAAEALSLLPWQPSDPSQPVMQAIILEQWDRIISYGISALEPLLTALVRFDSLSQKNAAIALGEIGDSRAPDPLLTALDSVDMGVRKAVVQALAKIGDARAIEGIVRAKSDSLKPVRDAALLALQQLGLAD